MLITLVMLVKAMHIMSQKNLLYDCDRRTIAMFRLFTHTVGNCIVNSSATVPEHDACPFCQTSLNSGHFDDHLFLVKEADISN